MRDVLCSGSMFSTAKGGDSTRGLGPNFKKSSCFEEIPLRGHGFLVHPSLLDLPGIIFPPRRMDASSKSR